MISKGGMVIIFFPSTVMFRKAIQAGSMGSPSEHSTLHISQVVHTRKVSTASWSSFSLPSSSSRRKNHLPRGDWLSHILP